MFLSSLLIRDKNCFVSLRKFSTSIVFLSTRPAVEFTENSVKYENLKRRKMLRSQLMNPSTMYTSLGGVAGRETVKIKFLFPISIPQQQPARREVELERNLDEPWSQTLSRLALKLNNLTGIKQKSETQRKFQHGYRIFGAPNSNEDQQDEDPNMYTARNIRIETSDGSIVDPDLGASNREAFLDLGAWIFMRDLALKIERNVPFFLKLKMDLRMFAGYPVMPSARISSETLKFCRFDWFLEREVDTVTSDLILNMKYDERRDRFEVENFRYENTGLVYVPKEGDVGKHLLLIAYPKTETSTGECMDFY